MIADTKDLDRVIDSVHQTMKSARAKLKNDAIIRNLTDLRKSRQIGPFGLVNALWFVSGINC